MKPVKAYDNREFLMGEEARTVRILCEYLEPMTRLDRYRIRHAIIFFGSARMQPDPKSGPDYYAMATELAERLARWTTERHAAADRYYICNGGGPGLMQAVHEGSSKVDRSLNIGLNISLPFEQNINEWVDPERVFEFHYFFMRKFWFMKISRAAAVFPGGFGTLDELFEMLTLTQTGKSTPMPMVLFGREFWEATISFTELAQRGYISPDDTQLFRLVETVDEAFAFLTEGLAAKGA